MRILVVSGLPWNKNNSFGSTFSSIFEGMQDVEFLNIYTGYGLPDNNLDVHSLQMTELSLLKNIVNAKKNKSLIKVTDEHNNRELVKDEQGKVNKLRKYNNRIVFWARCFIWKIGRWKSRELYDEIVTFKPDVIFSILYYNPYLNNLTLYCHEITNAPIAIYSTDDVYSLPRKSLSPFYWIEKLIIRRNIRRLVQCSKACYAISKEQKEEYQRCFGREFKILTKGDDFNKEIEIKHVSKPILIVYTGALYFGRFNSLKLLMEAIDEYSGKEDKCVVKIYSNTVLNNKEKRVLKRYRFAHWMGGVPASEIKRVQSEADILLHLESLNAAESFEVRLSFSTKLVEYFKSGRAVLAIGRKSCASCSYLVENKCGYVVESKEEAIGFLKNAYNNPNELENYAMNAVVVGRKNHQIDVIQANLKQDLEEISKRDVKNYEN